MILRTDQTGDLMAALAKAQGEFPPIKKDTKNYYGRNYAQLDAIVDAVRPALSKNGIAFYHIIESDLERRTASVTTYLQLGEQWIADFAEASAVNRQWDKQQNSTVERFDTQTISIVWTYFKRTTLQAVTGTAAEEDTDAQELVGNNPPQPARRILPSEQGAIFSEAAGASGGAQPFTQRPAAPQQASQPQAGALKFIPPNGLIAVIKDVKEIVGIPAKLATDTLPAMKAVRARMIVTFLGKHNGVDQASCFDTKFWPALHEAVGLECYFQIAEKDVGGKHYINIEDLAYVAGEEFLNGKPVVTGEKQ
jgi:hypothetical protein